MWKRMFTLSIFSMAALVLTTGEALSQPGRGKGGGGRSAGHTAPSAPKLASAGPAMTRPGGAPQAPAKLGGTPNLGKQGGGAPRPNVGAAGSAKPNGGFQRPTIGSQEAPKRGGDRPQIPGKADQPKIGGERPGLPGKVDRPNIAARPGGGASSSQLNDFLGGGGRPSEGIGRPELGKGGLPKIGKDEPKFGRGDLPKIGKDEPKFGKGDLPKIGDRGPRSPNISVGNVNIGNSVEYSKNQKAWVDNHHATGNQVRVNAGNRYTGAYNSGVYRRGAVGGYPYYNEATEVSRSLKGMLDQTSQRAAVGFADGKNAEVVMETGIYNLTQDEAPALLHQGKERSTPVLLVRLQAPADNAGN